MKISTLLKHSSELLQIILKSQQPADLIASKYFRAKKYIGSKERKFISELVFSSIRIKILIEFLIIRNPLCCSPKLTKKTDNKKNISPSGDAHFLCLIFSTLFFAHNFIEIKLFSPKKIIKKILCQENFDLNNILFEAMSFLLNESIESMQNFADSLSNSFAALNEEAKNIKNKYKNSFEAIEQKDIETLCYRYSFPLFLFKKMFFSNFNKLSISEAADLAESLMQSAPLTIRVNTIYSTTNKVLSYFQNLNIECEKSRLSPDGITINKRLFLDSNDLYKNGTIEVQDDASQLVAFAFEANKHKTILDACAGAGGKSLHLAAINQDKLNIVSSDIEFNKLQELKKRAKRAGLNSIKTQLLKRKDISKSNFNPYGKTFDAILIDAPCSGTGTVRRSPMLKYLLDEKQLSKRTKAQFEIISYYSKFLKINGILVYSTCSILPQENEEIISKFLAANPHFAPDPIKPIFEGNNVFIDSLAENDYFVTLLPSKYNCDGFFIARLKKIGETYEF